MSNWIDICWDADDGLPVDHPDHIWGATGCEASELEHVCTCLDRDYPGVLISLFFDKHAGLHAGLRQHLAETGRSL